VGSTDGASRQEALEKHEAECRRGRECGKKRSSRGWDSASQASPLRAAAFTACVEAGKALTIPELASAVKEIGYKSRSSRFQSYLRRVVRSDRRLVSNGPDSWTLRREPGGGPDAERAEPRGVAHHRFGARVGRNRPRAMRATSQSNPTMLTRVGLVSACARSQRQAATRAAQNWATSGHGTARDSGARRASGSSLP